MIPDEERKLRENILRRSPRERIDAALDIYLDGMMRATEWDARQWGFDPYRWFRYERAQLRSRGGRDWPAEVI